MSIEIEWTELLPDSPEWDYQHVLYAYLNPHTAEIIYLGMAWHRTVRQRFQDGDKDALGDFFINELGLKGVKVIVGSVWLEGRLTRQLLLDIESLLIRGFDLPVISCVVRRGFPVPVCGWSVFRNGRISVLGLLMCVRGRDEFS